MMMMTSKIWKSDPLQQAIKIKNSSFHIIQHWPSKRCSINDCCLWKIKKQKKSCQNPSRIQKRTSKTSIAAAKKNSIYKWAASFYLMNISMPNNDRTGGTFLNYPQKRCYTDITCSQKPKNNSFLFLKKTTYLFYNSTTMNQIYFQNCMWLCMTLYLLTYYLKVLTYFWFLFSFFVFSLFLFSFFFVKNQIQTTFFVKKF